VVEPEPLTQNFHDPLHLPRNFIKELDIEVINFRSWFGVGLYGIHSHVAKSALVDHPLRDFGPISLIHLVAKLFAKVLSYGYPLESTIWSVPYGMCSSAAASTTTFFPGVSIRSPTASTRRLTSSNQDGLDSHIRFFILSLPLRSALAV
jgi:hypothetical protein